MKLYLLLLPRIHELTRIKKIKAIPEVAGRTPFKRAKAILQRQHPNNALFTEKIESYIDHMEQHIEISDDPLHFVHDNPGYTLEKQCHLYQAAISGWDNTKWIYIINGKAWNFMDHMNMATLVLHEVIYRLAYERGQLTSTNTKLVVQALLTQDQFSDPNKFFDLRKKLDIVVAGE